MGEGASSYEAGAHYDRVTDAWTLLLGDELHYGVFIDGSEPLAEATGELTRLMIEATQPRRGLEILDVGCGTGAPARRLAREFGARVTGITTSAQGVAAARDRAAAEGLTGLASFEQRDGMDNGFANASFDRAWVLESSHLMRHRGRLLAECARVLRPGGRLALCDIMLRRPMDFGEVRRLREPLALLRGVFGDARMEPLEEYARLAEANGLVLEQRVDLTRQTRPTFQRWRANAERHRDDVVAAFGEPELDRFVRSCDVLEAFWDDDTLGYGLLAASKPGAT